MDTKENKEFKPFIAEDKVTAEMTPVSLILGIILAVVFGGANAYLALRVGMTVSASIPAAVVSMGIVRGIMKRNSILENNMVQTIGSAGESLAAGAVFTLPAIFMWMNEGAEIELNALNIVVIAIAGGILGILFMIPLRQALIVKEHGTLPYPEGTACAEVLIAGEEGGAAAGTVFAGLGIAAVYKFIADGISLFPSEVAYEIKKYKGSGIGIDVLPSLLGVGYICGARIASFMFAGGVLAWFVIMPMIAAFGGDVVLFPAEIPISDMSANQIWSNYVRYIGAGAVTAGGIISLIKSLPMIVRTFKENVAALKNKEGSAKANVRTQKDLSVKTMAILAIVMVALLILTPGLPFGIISIFMIVIFGFFFATVSSRMVGLVGSSNNPVSGMTIATLLIATILLKASGSTGVSGMVAAIMIGTVICIIASMAGDISQDLKTGYIVGATPKLQQIGEIIGVLASSVAISAILVLFDKAWTYGSTELPAPQATLMKLVVEGVMGGDLPWNLVFIGIFIAVAMEVLGIAALPVAIGVYLPIYLSVPIMIGGIVRWFVESRKFKSEDNKKTVVTRGILYSSGLIAGEGIIGIVLAILAVVPVGDGTLGDAITSPVSLGNVGSIILFALLVCSLLNVTIFSKIKEK